jgi:hypothetical protein
MAKPKVLIVDDREADREYEAVVATGRVDVEAVYPEEIRLEMVESAHLVLVDYDLRHWTERANSTYARRPTNGLSLIPILRESLREKVQASPGFPIPAFAILTNELSQLAGHFLPDDYREHALARLHNIEWAFAKTDRDRGARIATLAEAMLSLPREWPDDRERTFAILGEYLQVGGLEASDDDPTYRAISRGNPPVHEFSKSSHGISVLRWLLHRVLPYPTFLVGDESLAERFGADPDVFRETLKASESLQNDLDAHLYRGALAGFLGDRWWIDAVGGWFWELTEGKSPSTERLRHAVLERYGVELPPSVAGTNGIVVHDAHLKPKGRLAPAGRCWRIEPDDWPPFARYAYAERDDVANSPLLGLIANSEEGR